MNPYKAPIQAELVPEKKPPRITILELIWRIVILLIVGSCFWIAFQAWCDLLGKNRGLLIGLLLLALNPFWPCRHSALSIGANATRRSD